MLKRLTILAGAGFSQPFHIPTSNDLTEITKSLRHPLVSGEAQRRRAAAALYDALSDEYSAVNFELALHAIEALLSYCARNNFNFRYRRVHHVLRPFTSPKKKWLSLLNFDCLRQLRMEFIKSNR